MIKTRYKILFTIELLHDYFSSGKYSVVSILPILITIGLLNNRIISHKKYSENLAEFVSLFRTGQGFSGSKVSFREAMSVKGPASAAGIIHD
ncbi:MAG: hypothetical protein C4308_00100 [Chitinophagaceae bacterium]